MTITPLAPSTRTSALADVQVEVRAVEVRAVEELRAALALVAETGDRAAPARVAERRGFAVDVIGDGDLARVSGDRAALAQVIGAGDRTALAQLDGAGESAAQVAGAGDSDVAGGSAAVVALIAALEGLKAVACAAQARLAVALDVEQRERQAVAGVPARRRGLGVATQVGLARHESPHRGRVLLGAAKVWVGEMPHTFAALTAGRLSEHRAVLLVAETACLEAEDRALVDRLMCADPAVLAGVGTARMVAMARAHGARLDPAALVRRARRAECERRVTMRPAPDAMVHLSALLPMKLGISVYAALKVAADAARARPGGDDRGAGQIMADTLAERVTGRSVTEPVPVTVNLTISDTSLLGADHQAAHVDGFGPVPAQIACELTAAGMDAGAAWLRRLYTDPGGRLVALSSRERFFAGGLAAFLRVRDQGMCRTPYCDAPIRHLDHIIPAAGGGVTDDANGQGLCQACNHAKQAPGWGQRTLPDQDRHTVETTTPTGHRYTSHAPPPPVPAQPATVAATARATAAAVRADGAHEQPPTDRAAVDLAFAQLLSSLPPLEYIPRAA